MEETCFYKSNLQETKFPEGNLKENNVMVKETLRKHGFLKVPARKTMLPYGFSERNMVPMRKTLGTLGETTCSNLP